MNSCMGNKNWYLRVKTKVFQFLLWMEFEIQSVCWQIFHVNITASRTLSWSRQATHQHSVLCRSARTEQPNHKLQTQDVVTIVAFLQCGGVFCFVVVAFVDGFVWWWFVGVFSFKCAQKKKKEKKNQQN